MRIGVHNYFLKFTFCQQLFWSKIFVLLVVTRVRRKTYALLEDSRPSQVKPLLFMERFDLRLFMYPYRERMCVRGSKIAPYGKKC